MKKFAVLALGAALTLSLAACAPTAEKPKGDGGADTVTTASVTTGLYTNLSQQELLEAIAAYSGVSVVSTVNADGTPNIAIFTPGAAGDDSHILFGLADNATKTNILRDKVAKMVFDKPNTAAETKEGRHTGAVVKLELEEDKAVLDGLKANNEVISDAFLVMKIVEVLPVG